MIEMRPDFCVVSGIRQLFEAGESYAPGCDFQCRILIQFVKMLKFLVWLYLIARPDIVILSIFVHSVGDVGRLLFDGDEQIERTPVKS